MEKKSVQLSGKITPSLNESIKIFAHKNERSFNWALNKILLRGVKGIEKLHGSRFPRQSRQT